MDIVTWKHMLEQRTEYTWEHLYGPADGGLWYVVEGKGSVSLRTGPFKTKEDARRWFRDELDVELLPKDGD